MPWYNDIIESIDMTTPPPAADKPSGARPAYPYEPPVYRRTNYTPTYEQLARDDQHRRYMRRNVYTPAILAAVLALAVLILIVVLAFFVPQTGDAREFISGMSGLIIILFTLPVISFMALLSLAYFGYRLYRRQQRRENPEFGPTAYRSRIQLFLWQVESAIDTARRSVDKGADSATHALISVHARAAYTQQWLRDTRDTLLRRKPL